MKINPKSWHAKVFRWSYWYSSYGAPATTNLCQYMRRLIFSPLSWLAQIILLMLYTLVGFGALLFGRYPTFDFTYRHEPPLAKYPGFQLGKFELYPWHVLAPLVFIGLQVALVMTYNWTTLIGEVIIIVIAAAVIGLVAFIESGNAPDFPSIVYEYVHTKKHRFCPTVEFVDPSTIANEPTSEVSPLSSTLPEEEQDGGESS